MSIWTKIEEVIKLSELVDHHFEELEADPVAAEILKRYYQGSTLEELKKEFQDIEVEMEDAE